MTTPKEPEPKAPTAEDVKKLQSTYDKQLAAKDKELSELKAASKRGDPAVVDDIAVQEAATKLATEKADFDKAKVTWHRERIAAEYKMDIKELEAMDDPRDMELFALKKNPPKAGSGGRTGADREPDQTRDGLSYHDRMRAGIEARLKRFTLP